MCGDFSTKKSLFLVLGNVPFTMPNWFTNYQEARNFFSCLKKKFASFLISITRIIYISFYSISFIQFDFIFIIYIMYNKFITFLSYFDHDRKCLNSRIVVDNSYHRQPWSALLVIKHWLAGLCTADRTKTRDQSLVKLCDFSE